jgi:hypothetical protein
VKCSEFKKLPKLVEDKKHACRPLRCHKILGNVVHQGENIFVGRRCLRRLGIERAKAFHDSGWFAPLAQYVNGATQPGNYGDCHGAT